MADRPVAITVGALWRFEVEPSPPRPIRLSAAVTAWWVVITLARLIFGVVYFRDCPQQPNIPNYLLGLALLTLLMMPFVILPCESYAAHPQEPTCCIKDCMLGLLGLFFCILILAGDVWVFSVYQPNYDPTAADGLYCDKTLYTFAFWNAVWETFVFLACLASICKGVVCCVTMSPAPANRDFHSYA